MLPLDAIGTKFSYSNLPTIANHKVMINNEYVQYKSTVSLTDEVIVDTNKFTLELNGANKLSAWYGDFSKLEAGENTISESDDSSSGALIIFELRERWL